MRVKPERRISYGVIVSLGDTYDIHNSELRLHVNALNHPHSDRSSAATSYTLLEQVRQQDQAAWFRLTELYGPLIYHWCRQSGLQAEDSADILQEVFRSLVTHIGGFERSKANGSFRA